ncbi:MAG TPA: hypothetical protein PLW99_02695 [Candidatus Paceibacterota bacterium]|nr:MAG: hypothetical protein B7X03_01860 [Parcubacteria group bacterium 21-58-10]HQT83031.1 hypothetical protein [Candidatus Paceibacterota bacterium]
MNVRFTYDENKDIQCLLEYGAGSQNSPKRTKAYEDLLAYTDGLSDTEKVRAFVRDYISKHSLDLLAIATRLQQDWDGISERFEERVEHIFGAALSGTFTAYVTIAGRYPYNLKEHYFFVSPAASGANRTAMHELLHFYTWEAFGDYVRKGIISAQKYNDLKESLTVLLNLEFSDLLSGDVDKGYPQHTELRARVAALWSEHKDIRKVFKSLIGKE